MRIIIEVDEDNYEAGLLFVEDAHETGSICFTDINGDDIEFSIMKIERV